MVVGYAASLVMARLQGYVDEEEEMRLACFVLTAAIVLSVPAGQASAMETAIGGKSGIALSSIYGDNGDIYDAKTGFLVGGFVTVYFSEYLGIQAEFMYIMKGANATVSFYDPYDEWYYTYNAKFSFGYIEVPMLLKMRIPISDGFSPNFFIGPAMGINIGATAEVDDLYYRGSEVDIDGISSVDFGVVAGFGVDVSLEPFFFTCDARYEMGLANINDADYWADHGYDSVAEEKNHAVIFSIGLGLSL